MHQNVGVRKAGVCVGAQLLGRVINRSALQWHLRPERTFLTAQMSVLVIFGGPHLPLAFQFVCGPGGSEGISKQIGRQVEGFPSFAPTRRRPSGRQYKLSRTTFRNNCAVCLGHVM